MKDSSALILLLTLVGSPIAARPAPPPSGTGVERLYVRARAAAALGDDQDAAILLGRASAAISGDADLARRAFLAALMASDRPLASAAADRLAAANALPANAAFLRLATAVAAHDWRASDAAIDVLASDRALGFSAPLLRAWTAFVSHRGDPMALIASADAHGVPDLAVHRALLALATGQPGATSQASAAIAAGGSGSALHQLRLRMAGAAALAQAGDRSAADALLAAGGPDPALTVARRLIDGGHPLPEAIAGPGAASATMLATLATEIARDRTNPVALVLARIASMVAPADPEPWIVIASITGAANQGPQALAALDHVNAGDPLGDAARQLRVSVLAAAGDKAQAFREAQALAATTSDPDMLVALGDTQAALGKFHDAAASYARAATIAAAHPGSANDLWTYDLMAGGAYDQAGEWAAAKPLLQQAVTLAPDNPTALNYLGYASLEQHDDVTRATQLIERAHKLAPDNGAITDSLGWAYYLTGRLPEAIAMLESAAESEPSDITINEHLGDAYWAVGRGYEARYAWRAASIAAEPKDAARLAGKIAGGPPGTQPPS